MAATHTGQRKRNDISNRQGWLKSLLSGQPNPVRVHSDGVYFLCKITFGHLHLNTRKAKEIATYKPRLSALCEETIRIRQQTNTHATTANKKSECEFTFALWVGKLPTSRRYNLLPLLRSSPGGFAGSWPYRTYPYTCLKNSYQKHTPAFCKFLHWQR